MKRIKDSQDWFGIKGARVISHGEWSDSEVIYNGCSYNLSELTEDMWNNYESHCDDEGIEPTEEGFEEWEGLEGAAESALYDLYPYEVVDIISPETFKVKVLNVEIDEDFINDVENGDEENEDGYDLDELRDFPFHEGDTVNISEIKEWFESSSFYDFGVISDSDDSVEITVTATTPYVDLISMTVENAMGEYYPKAGDAMETYLD